MLLVHGSEWSFAHWRAARGRVMHGETLGAVGVNRVSEHEKQLKKMCK